MISYVIARVMNGRQPVLMNGVSKSVNSKVKRLFVEHITNTFSSGGDDPALRGPSVT